MSQLIRHRIPAKASCRIPMPKSTGRLLVKSWKSTSAFTHLAAKPILAAVSFIASPAKAPANSALEGRVCQHFIQKLLQRFQALRHSVLVRCNAEHSQPRQDFVKAFQLHRCIRPPRIKHIRTMQSTRSALVPRRARFITARRRVMALVFPVFNSTAPFLR
jgi:hypothetical protein